MRLLSLPPPGGLIYVIISSPFEGLGGGGLNRRGTYLIGRGLFNLETTMVSVLYKELDYKVESSSVQEVLGHAGRGLESNPNFQLGNNKTIPDQSTRLVLQP